jgi:hypothetical protein
VKKPDKISSKLNRQEAIRQGFYDGRFRNRKIEDKKKDLNKRWCRLSSTVKNTGIA